MVVTSEGSFAATKTAAQLVATIWEIECGACQRWIEHRVAFGGDMPMVMALHIANGSPCAAGGQLIGAR